MPVARTRILYWILIPVLGVGVLIAVVAVRFSEPALADLFITRADSSLQLASRMAFTACETSFNYLLDLRLEDDLELNDTLRRETVEEIRSISRDFEGIELVVLDGAGRIVGASGTLANAPLPSVALEELPTSSAAVRELWGETVRTHSRYFPFWDWRVVSAVREVDVLAPLRAARRAVIVGLASGILLLVGTLYGVFRFLVDRPLRHLALATEGVVEGRYVRIPQTRRDEIGQVVGAFNGMIDALEAKEADVESLVTELRTSEDRFRTLFESSPLGIGLIDPEGTLLESNSSMLELLGRSKEEAQNMPLAELFQRPEEGTALLERLAEVGIVRSEEAELRRSDGTHYSARITGTQLQLGDQEATLVLAEDITREKRLQESLERARKMEALGTLAGGVAHDLNNILSGVVGYPELMLLDLPPDSPLVKPVQAIKRSGERAAAIVQDLLTLARRGVASTEVVNLNRVVEEYLGSPEFEKLRFHHENIRVEQWLADDLLNVRGAPVHLAKTVMNLVSNAAEAMPQGGTVTVSTENRYVDQPVGHYDHVREGDYAILRVSDTGEGIAPGDLDRIFEPFFTKKVMGRSGTGLGMSVVWGTVKDHQGYIDVRSEPGRGTDFTLYFPVTRDTAGPAAGAFSIEDCRGNGEVVLVVDDVPEQRHLAEIVLTRLGYRVALAGSGEEAVHLAERGPVDLVLLDMIMDPGIDGLETYRRLVRVRPGLRAVIASGYSETGRAREAQRLGAGAYLRKPYTMEKLARALRAELQSGAAARSTT